MQESAFAPELLLDYLTMCDWLWIIKGAHETRPGNPAGPDIIGSQPHARMNQDNLFIKAGLESSS
jgi:hypothetical protein